ncbi:MAG: hypothetical protein ACREOZ_05100 [Gloeomargaritales cyanobacterium]
MVNRPAALASATAVATKSARSPATAQHTPVPPPSTTILPHLTATTTTSTTLTPTNIKN